jgi:hypothetical protein
MLRGSLDFRIDATPFGLRITPTLRVIPSGIISWAAFVGINYRGQVLAFAEAVH